MDSSNFAELRNGYPRFFKKDGGAGAADSDDFIANLRDFMECWETTDPPNPANGVIVGSADPSTYMLLVGGENDSASDFGFSSDGSCHSSDESCYSSSCHSSEESCYSSSSSCHSSEESCYSSCHSSEESCYSSSGEGGSGEGGVSDPTAQKTPKKGLIDISSVMVPAHQAAARTRQAANDLVNIRSLIT